MTIARQSTTSTQNGTADEAIREKHLGWLTSTPVSDLGFKSSLEDAPLWLLREALEKAQARPAGNKTRITALERRVRLLEKWQGTPRAVACPVCKAPVGSPCKRPSGHPVPGNDFHVPRKLAAEGQA